MTLIESENSGQWSLPTQQNLKQVVEKICLQAGQKDLRGEAREIATSGGVLTRYVGARRLSATKHMSLFQQAARI